MSAPQNLAIQSHFATPIAEAMLPGMDELNTRLRALFLEWEADTNRKRLSEPTPVIKVGVYESDFHLFSRDHPDIRALANLCLNHLGFLVAQINGYSAEG